MLQAVPLRFALHAGAAQDRADARHQLAGRERLDQVVVRTQLEAGDAILDLTLGGQHDDGDIRGGAHDAADLFTGNARQHEVKDDHVERVKLELVQRLLPIGSGRDPKTLFVEVCGYNIANRLLVLDKQDSLRLCVWHFVLPVLRCAPVLWPRCGTAQHAQVVCAGTSVRPAGQCH